MVRQMQLLPSGRSTRLKQALWEGAPVACLIEDQVLRLIIAVKTMVPYPAALRGLVSIPSCLKGAYYVCKPLILSCGRTLPALIVGHHGGTLGKILG